MDTHVAVLGATGRVGTLVVRQALDRGWSATALVRDPARLAADLRGRSGLRIVTGSIDDPAAMREVMSPAPAAVIVAVGVRYRRRHPWSGIEGRPDVAPAAVRTALAAAPAGTRFVLLSAFGVGDSWRRLPAPVRAVLATSSLRVAYRELAVAERLVAAATPPGVVVRAVTLTDGPATGRADATGRPLRGNPKVSRADVAGLLLDTAAGRDVRGGRVLVAAG
ncbi:NADH-flavin reductase [Catellatospora sp. IY07-71]|uniref:NAD(P)-dependent oxidoreductase n=1 Tax=Catellatospora sp. IY07-71 TaxID=2728827 RepID=UPI001BB3ED9B|nr:NAD(P)-binding oxidoreductase [Catellatospora sp. IY07-71]BCJ73796.1 NADH-flavin reductase [Catellatospora sp. IY07-71]